MNLKFQVFLALLLAFPAMVVSADVIRLAPGHPDEYIVRKGDTLWDISGRFLEKPWRWPEVWNINPQIENPHLIFPGDTVRLVYDEDGAPRLELERGGAGAGEVAATPRGSPADRDVKLSPRIRISSNAGAIETLPLKVLRPFLKELLIVEKDEMESWPYVVAMGERGERRLGIESDKVYLRGDVPEGQRRFVVYRESHEIRHAPARKGEQGEVLGYRADLVGTLEILKRGDPTVAVIIHSTREMQLGDRLRVTGYGYSEGEQLMGFVPHAPERDIDGYIVDVVGGVRNIGQFHVVVLDVGREAGVDPGSVVSIYQAFGGQVNDPIEAERKAEERRKQPLYFEGEENSPATNLVSQVANDARRLKQRFDDTRLGRFLEAGVPPRVEVQLPSGYIGKAMVFRSYPNLSYALIVEMDYPPVLYDKVGNPR